MVQPAYPQTSPDLPKIPVYQVDPTWPRPCRPDLVFVREQFIARDTKGAGSIWDIEFSLDEHQRFMYVADGTNEKVWILERDSLNVLGAFGSSGNEGQYLYRRGGHGEARAEVHAQGVGGCERIRSPRRWSAC